LKIDENDKVLGKWLCFGCSLGNEPILLRADGYIDAVNYDSSLAYTYVTNLRQQKIRMGESVSVWQQNRPKEKAKYRISAVETLSQARERWPASVRVTAKWTRGPDADPNEQFITDLQIDENRKVISRFPCFGLLKEMGTGYPCLLNSDGEIKFNNTAARITSSYSTNMLTREVRRNQYVSIWSGTDHQGEEWGFEITDIVILGSRELS
jgi:hypothetical protein